jgi:hypothetical protein
VQAGEERTSAQRCYVVLVGAADAPVGIGLGATLLGGGIAMLVLGRTTYELDEAPREAARQPQWWRGEF